MAVTIEGFGTASGVASGDMSPTNPTTVKVNDVLFCVIEQGDNVVASMPGGWTNVYAVDNTAVQRASLWWKLVASADEGGDTVTVTRAAGDTGLAYIFSVRGAHTTTPINTSGTQTSAASTTVTAPTITPTVAGCHILAIAYLSGATTVGLFSGTTPLFKEQFDINTTSGVQDATLKMDGALTQSTSALGAKTATAGASLLNVGAQVAIAPSGATTPTRFEVVQVACNTSTGNQSISPAVALANTPVAAFLWCNLATAVETGAAGAVFSKGATDGSLQWVLMESSQDNVADTNNFYGSLSTAVVCLLNPADGSVDGQASVVSLDQNGITINWTNAPAAAYLLNVMFLCCAEARVLAGQLIDGTPTGTSTSFDHTLSAAPSMEIGTLRAFPIDSPIDAAFARTLGFVTNTGSILQTSLVQFEFDALADGQPNERVHSSALDGYQNYSTVTSITSTQITRQQTTDTGGSDTDLYLSLLLARFDDGAIAYTAVIDSPVTVALENVYVPGMRPEFHMHLASMLTAVNTQTAADPSAELFGVGARSRNAAVTASVTLEDGATTINTNSYADTEAAYYKNGAGTTQFDLNVMDFYNRRMQWAFGTTNATARKWAALWVGPPATSDSTGRSWVPGR
jgi:hypothetical protein